MPGGFPGAFGLGGFGMGQGGASSRSPDGLTALMIGLYAALLHIWVAAASESLVGFFTLCGHTSVQVISNTQ